MCKISCATSSWFVNILLLVSLRQFRGVFMNRLNIILCRFSGLVFNKVQYIMTVLFIINGRLFNGDFVGFYLSYATYGSELFNPFLYHCVIGRGGGDGHIYECV